ncbi:MAG TPA: HepT-like ribonuclease domain-containing protein [Patescibacteria group bacterium]|nr:HepT-like ribonuclease domain-containing protein [Patescibacteria group bacterium]
MPDVDWRGLKGLRDFLAHNYPAVVVGIIASTLDDDVPILVRAVRRFLAVDGQTKG